MRFVACVLAVLFAMAGPLGAETVSARIPFVNEKWIKVGLASEGVQLTEIRFKVEGGIHYNPLRLGKGPQCFVQIKNAGGHAISAAVALALFDESGNLVGATESGHGEIDPDEASEIKMTFREVHRRLYEAKSVHVVLETWK